MSLIPDDPALGELTYYSVGILAEKQFDAETRILAPSGSGVLVEVGGIRGILTAGHVLRALREKDGLVGLFTITRASGKARTDLQFEFRNCNWISLGEVEKETGPDLAFIRLPIEIEGRLKTENIFYNFDRMLKDVTSGSAEANLPYTVMVGVPEERSGPWLLSRSTIKTSFAMIHVYCTQNNERDGGPGSLDTFDLHPHHSDEVPLLHSYGGMSGSGVWRICEKGGAKNRVLVGVAFYQREADASGKRAIVCHGPNCLYKELVEKIAGGFKDFRSSSSLD